MKKYFGMLTILGIILTLNSCEKSGSLEQKLVNTKYWDRLYFKEKGIIGCYEFKKNGNCNFYTYGPNSKQADRNKWVRNLYIPADVAYSHTWKLKDDSTLAIEYIDYRIVRVFEDSILIRNIKQMDSTMLIDSKIRNIMAI